VTILERKITIVFGIYVKAKISICLHSKKYKTSQNRNYFTSEQWCKLFCWSIDRGIVDSNTKQQNKK